MSEKGIDMPETELRTLDPIHQVFYWQLPMLSCPKTATLKNDTEFPGTEYTLNPKEVHAKWWDMSLSCVDDGHHIDNAEIMTQRDSKSRGPPNHPQWHHWLLPTIHDRRSHFHSAYNWLWSQPFAKRTIRTTALFTSSAEKWGWSVVQNIRITQKYGWS